MSKVREVRWRVVRDHVEQLAVKAEWSQNEDTQRLALACLALLDRHRPDSKGRCGQCARRGRWRRNAHRCVVLEVIEFWTYEASKAVLAADP